MEVTPASNPLIPELFPDYYCDGCDYDVSPSDHPQCGTCDKCDSCCECYECDDCGTTNPSDHPQCGTCDKCDSCCNCTLCQRCEENISPDDTICPQCNYCESCCDNRGRCWNCDGCDRRYDTDTDYSCSECNECESCCECHSCEHCGERYRHNSSSFCTRCDRCDGCCNCSDEDNSGVLTDGTLTFHAARKTEHARNPSKRYISLELEVCGDDGSGWEYVKPVAERWNDAIVEDGSLPDSGYEINSNPSSGDVFLRHIEELCSGLNLASARVDRSCGMHCHIAAPDYSYFDLFKLCRLYSTIETALFSLVSSSRRNGNRYAERCADRYTFTHYATFKVDLIRALYGEDALTIHTSYDSKKKPYTSFHRGKNRLSNKTSKYDSARYYALNIHSFFYRGTIEFRHHQGTTLASKATGWGMVCAAIVDAASRLTIAQIDSLPSNPFERLLAILPNDALREWAKTRRDELTK